MKTLNPILAAFLIGFILSSLLFSVPEYLDVPTPFKKSAVNLSKIRRSNKNLPSVLCWILTGPSNLKTKAVHVQQTWGSHCDKLLFMSSEADSELGAIKLEGSAEGRQGLWGKTKRAFKYVYQNHFDEYDWFMKADDDTFVIIENLKSLLSNYSTNDPIHFGHTFKYGGDYFSGGAGYVLSREALARFVERGVDNSTICHQGDDGDEDAQMGECMRNLNVTHGDSRDRHSLKRFFPFHPVDHIVPRHGKKDEYYLNVYEKYPEKSGTACCSDSAISFHYISPPMLYVMYYLVYHLRNVEKGYELDQELSWDDIADLNKESV